jgi:hypothetical protein
VTGEDTDHRSFTIHQPKTIHNTSAWEIEARNVAISTMMSCVSSPFLRIIGEKKYSASEEVVQPAKNLFADRLGTRFGHETNEPHKRKSEFEKNKSVANSEFGTSSMVRNVLADQDQIKCDTWHLRGTMEWPPLRMADERGRETSANSKRGTTKHNMWSVSVG